MLNSPKAMRIAIDGLIWAAIAVCAWFMLTRHFVAFFAASGRWQTPGISRVHVGHVHRDVNDTFFDTLVTVKKDGTQKVNRLLKEELIGIHPGDIMWLIHAPYVTTFASPPTYRFSIFRLVAVFPEIFMLIFGSWLFARFRSRLGKPYDAYEGAAKPTTTYVVPSPDSWGRSKLFIVKKDQGENS